MRKIILYMFVTLDGFVAGPNGEFDDFEPSLEEHQFANELFRSAGGLLFGRITYHGFSDYWDALDLTDPSVPAIEREFAQIFRTQPRVVFSQTLERVDDQATLIKNDLIAEVTKVKEQVGNDLLLICGPALLAALTAHQLIDECILLIKPRVLGRGKALFGEIVGKLNLQLVSTRNFASGVVLHHYRFL